MELRLELCTVRSWCAADVPALARHADDAAVARNLRDAFPHPYGEEDARGFIAMASEAEPETVFAIDVGGEAVGGIGFHLGQDVARLSAEIGYWLARPFWGRGIVTEALRAVTTHAIETHGLVRLYAMPFAWNLASARVLEKAGYVREATMRRAAVKEGRVVDQWLYAYVTPDPEHQDIASRARGST
jgi:RimJ/RimL family protein N-acetyltransferase